LKPPPPSKLPTRTTFSQYEGIAKGDGGGGGMAETN